MRHGYAQLLADLEHRSGDRLEFERPPGFQILQHGGLVLADLCGAVNALLDRDRQIETQPRASVDRFLHDAAHQFAGVRRRRDPDQRRTGSALIGLNAMLPSSFTQISLRRCVVTGALMPAAIKAAAMLRDPLRAASVRLAQRDAVALDMADHAGLATISEAR